MTPFVVRRPDGFVGVELRVSDQLTAAEARELSAQLLDCALHAESGTVRAEDQVITITYINHRGETSVRQIIPCQIRFATSEWHPGAAQWLVDAFDVGRQQDRSFALADVIIRPRQP